MEMTVTGIEALTVSPTFNTRYNDDAPKISPSTVPTTSGSTESSRIDVDGAMYGLNGAGPSFIGLVR